MHKDFYKDVQKWSKVIFSDQSKFGIEFGDRGALLWRTKDERYNPACLKRSVKFPTSVVVWSCVSTRGMGNIVFLKSTVTHTPYCVNGSVRVSHLLSIEDLYGDEDMIFQQDLASAHSSHSCTQTRSRHDYRSGVFKCSIDQPTIPTESYFIEKV